MNKKTELFLIIGFGQIGASIKDRLLNYKKLNDNFDICIYDTHKFDNYYNNHLIDEKFTIVNKLESSIEFTKYQNINIIVCIDTNKHQTFFESKNKSISSTLLGLFFTEKHLQNENTQVNIIIESTVPAGTAEQFQHKIIKQNCLKNYFIFSSPERYQEVYRVTELYCSTEASEEYNLNPATQIGIHNHSSTKIIGVCDPHGIFEETHIPYKRIESYIKAWENSGIKFKFANNSNEAELTKLLENHLRYMQLSTANLLELYLKDTDLRIDKNLIRELIGTKEQTKIVPGLIGGGCIPVDSDYLYAKDLMQTQDNFPKELMNESIEICHKINNRMFRDTFVNLINLIKVNLAKAKRTNQEFEFYMLGLGYKKNSPTIKNSKGSELIEDVLKEFENTNFNLDKLFLIDNCVDDYNRSYKYAPNYIEKKLKNLLPFEEFLKEIDQKNQNDQNPTKVKLIIINNDNDFIYNDKKYKYSTFLDEYNIPYYNIGDLK